MVNAPLYFVVTIVSCYAYEERPLANTVYGPLQGVHMTTRNGRQFSAFLGIPYAAPPVGPLRFQKPQPAIRWDGVRDASLEGNYCIQANYFFPNIQSLIVGDEDCLFLNVYTPNLNPSKLLPVMFYIHGGGFRVNSDSIRLHGPEFLLDKDIVLVVINYRLAAFGFLSTEDSVVPGNMGLKDQTFAMKWVQQNIINFGGNPYEVTIFGNSAGASCVHLHMMSPLSNGIFKRAISQSGSALSAFAIIGPGSSLALTKRLAAGVNCPTDNTHAMVGCLRSVPQLTIQTEHENILNSLYDDNVVFRPVKENPLSIDAFLTTYPTEQRTSVPWMTGINRDEGAFKLALILLRNRLAFIDMEFDKFGPQSMNFDDTSSMPVNISQQIRNYYFGNKTIDLQTTDGLIKMYTDSWILSGTVQSIQQHDGTLFYYMFDHRGQHSFTSYFGQTANLGVSHCDELIYLFTMVNLFPPTLNETDRQVSKLMVDLWTNFAIYGNPTPVPISDNPQTPGQGTFVWESTNYTNPKYLHIQTNKLTMEEKLYSDRVNFWKSLKIRDKLH